MTCSVVPPSLSVVGISSTSSPSLFYSSSKSHLQFARFRRLHHYKLPEFLNFCFSPRRMQICWAAAEYRFPFPIPEFAQPDTEKFKTHLQKKELFGDSLEEVLGVCTKNPRDVIELSGNSRINLDSCLSVFNNDGLREDYYNSNIMHSTSSISTTAVSLPPKPPPPPHRRLDEDEDDDNNDDFREKALFLDSIGIDSLSVLSRDPSALASASLAELKQLCEYLSSLGLSPSDLGRMASMCPGVLSLRLREAASVCSFLIREARMEPSGLRRAFHRRPRLLVSPVSSRLRPTLYFLQSLGIHDVTRHTYLLSCSVEDKFLPRIDYFQKLGFSYRESVSMFRRFPPLFCYSLQHNLEPKFNYFVVEMGRELKELREFPQFFSFTLDKRIKPRHQMCIHKGVYFPLNVMLKTTEQEFRRRLGISVDSSLPVSGSPLWCTNQSCLVNNTLQLDDNIL